MPSIFNNLSKNQVNKLFKLLGVHIYKYSKNQEILPTIKNKNIVGIILQGSAQIIVSDYNGNEILAEELSENSVFGNAISALNSDDYQIIAKKDTEVVVIDYENLFYSRNIKYNYFNVFLSNLFSIVYAKSKEKNDRIRILEKKTIRDKLLEYFSIERKGNPDDVIYLPFSFKDLADYIGVNRSAMFRELKNLKDEGFVEVKGKKVSLLYKD